MKRIHITALILFSNLFAFSGSYLFHEPPVEVRTGKDLILSVTLISDNRVVEAKGYYRTKGNLSFQEMHLQRLHASWEMRINGGALSEKGLEYCFIFKMSDGGMLAFPKENPLEQPHVLVVLPMIFPEKIIDVIEPVFQQEFVSAEILI